jgi:hypothetical protein
MTTVWNWVFLWSLYLLMVELGFSDLVLLSSRRYTELKLAGHALQDCGGIFRSGVDCERQLRDAFDSAIYRCIRNYHSVVRGEW